MTTFYVVGGDDKTLTISSYRVCQAACRLSHAVCHIFHAVYHPVSYPNGVLFPTDPSSAVARGVV